MKQEVAIFAGGCFWCTQKVFDGIDGVLETKAGYTGGDVKHPTYEAVCSGDTGHVEAVKVVFDADKVPYERLLEVFWKSIDPKNSEGQFCDKGSQYMAIIFYENESQEKKALQSKNNIEKMLGKVFVEIKPSKEFFEAEDYHQKYYQKNSLKYEFYEKGSGRKS